MTHSPLLPPPPTGQVERDVHPHHRGEGRRAHEEGQGGPPQHPRDSAGHSCGLSWSFGCCISITVETVFPFLRLLYLPICSYCISLFVFVVFAGPQDTNCSVCFENMDDNNSRRLNPCGHRSPLSLDTTVSLHHNFTTTAPQLHHTAVSLHHTTHHNLTTLPFAPLQHTAQFHFNTLKCHFTTLRTNNSPHSSARLHHTV